MSRALDRFHHVVSLVDAESPRGGDGPLAERLDRICRVAVRLLPADGAGITMTDRNAHPLGTAAASSPLFRRLEDIQFTLGEGPCVEASAARSPAIEEDVGRTGTRRWPAFAAAALEEGVNAAFAFPVHVGAARLGVLDLYRYRAGPLTPESLRDALCLARVCLTTMLQQSVHGPVGDAADGMGDAFPLSSEVYQAQGVVMVQLEVPLAEAMVRLRAHAYASGQPIIDVARGILDGRIVFTREDV
ncbi:GAF and ANTAR domain-containing protein [Terrabacter carboxydivorans]|uniref:GAF and ANTAR domain-containing protein n=1 Tax=Terrabacter carboxydivorans TaxID=619730 RepID=UPI0031D9C553